MSSAAPRLGPVGLILLAMTSIQAGAAVAKGVFPLIGAPGFSALRLVFATLMLFAVFRPWRAPPTRAAWPPLLFYGAALGLMNLCFYLAIERVPLGIGVALEFTGPLALALFSSRRPLDILWGLLAGSGVFLLSPFAKVLSLGPLSPIDPLGALLALTAGGFWALYIVFGKRAGAAHGPAAAAWGMLIASLIVLPLGIAAAGGALVDPAVLPKAALVALLSSALPYSLEMVALSQLSTRLFGVLMSVEPALGALFGWLMLRETLEPAQLAGVAAVALASAAAALAARPSSEPGRDKAPQPP
jgi:inner membrane transporter RhtA